MLGSAIFGPTILAITGNYDDVNRLCTQVADRFGWGFVNINLRSYYAEGAKTLGFEIVEQLGWRFPQHLVSPVAGGHAASAHRRAAFASCARSGSSSGELPTIHAAQAAGCAPVVRTRFSSGADELELVRPNTIAKSIAIGNPADGQQVLQTVREHGRHRDDGDRTNRSWRPFVCSPRRKASSRSRPGARRSRARSISIERGVISADESVVVCVTGNGYKTTEVVSGQLTEPVRLSRAFKEFEAWWESRRASLSAT